MGDDGLSYNWNIGRQSDDNQVCGCVCKILSRWVEMELFTYKLLVKVITGAWDMGTTSKSEIV